MIDATALFIFQKAVHLFFCSEYNNCHMLSSHLRKCKPLFKTIENLSCTSLGSLYLFFSV